jgi:hypothetical protein
MYHGAIHGQGLKHWCASRAAVAITNQKRQYGGGGGARGEGRME